MRNKRGLQLDRVVLLGRTFEEYRRYFLLERRELIGKRVLDVTGGVSSFCADVELEGVSGQTPISVAAVCDRRLFRLRIIRRSQSGATEAQVACHPAS